MYIPMKMQRPLVVKESEERVGGAGGLDEEEVEEEDTGLLQQSARAGEPKRQSASLANVCEQPSQ